MNEYNPRRKRLTREQIAAIKRARRRKRMITLAFSALLAVVIITVVVLVLSALADRQGGTGLFQSKQTDAPVTITTAPPEEVPTTAYVEVPRSDIYEGELLLINKSHKVERIAQPTELQTLTANDIYGVDREGMMLQGQASAALHDWLAGYRASGGTAQLVIREAYRTEAEQQEIYDYYVRLGGKKYADEYVSPVGYSEHHTGLSLDLNYLAADGRTYAVKPTGDCAWLTENAASYGFILRYPEDKTAVTGASYESWHFRYVGIPHALKMKELNYCLEEYIEYVTLFSYNGEHLTVQGENGCVWEIYYCQATEDETQQIPIPYGAEDYRIDGDNMQGYIVTVKVADGNE